MLPSFNLVRSLAIFHRLLLGRCAATDLARGTAVEAAVRAERVRLAAADGTNEDGFEAEVREVVFEGDRLVYVLQADGLTDGRLVAFVHDKDADAAFRVGERVTVGWRPDDLLIFPA